MTVQWPWRTLTTCPHHLAIATPLATLQLKPPQNPWKTLNTTWRDLSLLYCLGVPAHINKWITQNLTNSRQPGISAWTLFCFIWCRLQKSICHFKAIIVALFHVREDTRHAAWQGLQRPIHMEATSFVWMLGKTNLQQCKKHSACLLSANICPETHHVDWLLADSFTGTL